MANHLPLLPVAGFLLALAPFAWAQSDVVETYDVRGTTYAQIIASLNKNAPYVERTKRRHYGVTEIAFRQNATYQTTPDGCELLGNEIDLELTMLLPVWLDRERATPAVAKRWDALRADIEAHEERHAQIARDYLARMRRQLDRPAVAEDCETLLSELRTRTDAMMGEHRDAQDAFDALTLSAERRP